jgi:hypothetical protein
MARLSKISATKINGENTTIKIIKLMLFKNSGIVPQRHRTGTADGLLRLTFTLLNHPPAFQTNYFHFDSPIQKPSLYFRRHKSPALIQKQPLYGKVHTPLNEKNHTTCNHHNNISPSK